MSKGHHHPAYPERCQIEALGTIGISNAAIAEQLGCNRSTVYKEIKRKGKRQTATGRR